ncbi:MAG: inorganic phosphate transporter [Planctomycetes bacterium]|nr:inorganic phosphate transporter [Planctomycetota bacterium]
MHDIWPVIPVLVLILWAEFVNGWTDAPNSIATAVSTRAMSPFSALVMAAVLNFVGALVTGTAVAITIGKGIVDPNIIDLNTIAAAMIGIIIWSTVAWFYGIPTSESHGLIAGLAGAGLAKAGPSVLLWEGWSKVILGLILSSIVGFLIGMFFTTFLYRLVRNKRPDKVQKVFGKMQLLSSAFMSFSHGSNDGQKFMGVFSLAILLYFRGSSTAEITVLSVPMWVMVICAVTMGFGTMFGGWRIIRTMGLRLTKLKPIDGFAAQTASAGTIQMASMLGIPLSTTHSITTTIMGVGATRRLSAVRWGVGKELALAWILTFPICAFIAFVTTKIFMYFSS